MADNRFSREQLAWAAGIVEGEGTLYAVSRSPEGRAQALVRVGMTDEDIVGRLPGIFGTGTVYGPYYGEKRKSLWLFSSSSFESAQAIVAAIWPWLGVRRRTQAKEMLAAANRPKLKWGQGNGRR